MRVKRGNGSQEVVDRGAELQVGCDLRMLQNLMQFREQAWGRAEVVQELRLLGQGDQGMQGFIQSPLLLLRVDLVCYDLNDLSLRADLDYV